MRASKLECALCHPDLAVTVAGDEKVIVAELTGWAWDLAVVGGHVGRRGPLVLCDAVKARRPDLPTLVLVGQETEEAELTAHEERGLEAVRYLDLRGASATVAELKSARIMALEMAGVEEDPGAAEEWLAHVAALEAAEAGGDEEETGDVTPEDGEAPAIVEQVTDEDLEFAQRTVAQTRHVDFRSPVPAAQSVDAADRQTAKLRDRVRELERNLARLAHVYGGRVREFDGAAEQLADADARNQSLKRDIERLREHFAEEREHWKAHRVEVEGRAASLEERAALLEGRVVEATEEVGRLRRELEAKESQHSGMLQQTQEAFFTLKETTAQVSSQFDSHLAAVEQQLRASREENERLGSELERVTAEHARAINEERAGFEGRIRELEVELDKAKQRHDAEVTARHQRNEDHIAQLREVEERAAEDRRALEERAAAELGQRSDELDVLRASVAAAQAREQELDAQLNSARQEAARQEERARELESAAAHRALELERVQVERTDETAQLQALRADLQAAQEEAKRLRFRTGEVEQQAVQARVDLEVAQRQHAAELERLQVEREEIKAAAATFRQAHEERAASISELERQIDKLRADLAARDAELAAVSEQHRDASRALEHERSRSLETVLDARLSAVEEFSRAASDRITEQGEILTHLDDRSARQEQFMGALVAAVAGPEPESERGFARPSGDTGRVATGDADEDLANLARRLVDARVHESAHRSSPWGWLRESPIHMLGAVFGVVVVAAAVVVSLRTTVLGELQSALNPEPPHPSELAAAPPVEPGREEPSPPELPARDTAAEIETDGSVTDDEAGGESVSKGELSPEELARRRGLRNRFFEAFKNKKWVRAVELGSELRDEFFLDWESHLRLADATRRSGDVEGAMELYTGFVEGYPDNAFAEEAQLRAANLLVKLERIDEAVPMLERLAEDPQGRFRKQAKQALNSLER